MTLLVLRHAPTAWNGGGRVQGRADIALAERGQYIAAGWRVPDRFHGASCLSSPLSRCLDTARAMGLSPVLEPRLVEMDWGRLEGLTVAEMRERGGAEFAERERLGVDFRPDGGESPREVRARALEALLDAPRTAVVVTHKGVMRALLSLALDWDMRKRPPVPLPPGGAGMEFLLDRGRLRLADPHVELWSGLDPDASPARSTGREPT